MAKFVPQAPPTKRIANDIVSVRLTPEIIAAFYELCKSTGLSPSRLGNQCIKFALENMK